MAMTLSSAADVFERSKRVADAMAKLMEAAVGRPLHPIEEDYLALLQADLPSLAEQRAAAHLMSDLFKPTPAELRAVPVLLRSVY